MVQIKLSVVLVFVCAIKCLAMSHTELEDFENFLKKTSQLSPTLKSAETDDDYDEDELVSDHAWELSGKFEGDLILNERQRRLIVEDVAEGLSRNGIRDGTKRWPNNEVIYFIQREHFSSDQMQAIQSGIDDLARASCVTFRPYRKGDRDAVVIQGSRRGCFSQVGYQGGYQVLNLSGRHPAGRGCFRHGTVVHELLHTLGFYHMQSSPDRDDYVNVIWENIIEPARHNFRKYNMFAVTDFGVGYDYDSVLHYSRRAFSANGKDTIVPKRNADIGQRIGLSDKDTQKLNKMYCDADTNEQPNQQADGEVPEKTDAKNQNTKSKPFDGHGIGYHQGKAVVIKLLPAAETYKLPDVPSFHVFDYFSKTPQTLPTSENQEFRVDKEIEYSYNPPEPSSTKKPILYTKSYTKVNEKESKPKIRRPHDKMLIKHDNKYTSSSTDAPRELFDSLSNIIKLHVYPSQSPNFDIYKGNEDSDRTSNKSEINQENDMAFTPYKQSDTKERQENMKTAVQYIQSFGHLNPEELIAKDYSKNVNGNEKQVKHVVDKHMPPEIANSLKVADSSEPYSSLDKQNDDKKTIKEETWYSDHIPEFYYHIPSKYHEFDSDSIEYTKRNSSDGQSWHDPHDARHNYRYSSFYKRHPEYFLFRDTGDLFDDY